MAHRNNVMRQVYMFCFVLVGWSSLWLSAVAAESVIVLPGITRNSEGVTTVALECNDKALLALGKRAFGMHGGFRVTENAQAAFFVQLQAIQSEVRVSVRSGASAGVLWESKTSDPNLGQALLRACDRAVEYMTGKPGFFAGKLAFVGKRGGVSELYSSDLFFRSVVALTADRALVTGPSWSPDGKKILYTTYFKSGFPDLYALDLGARQRYPIATYKGTNSGGRFSPDGSRIAMVISGSADTELCVSDASGKNLRRLTRNKSLESGPSWSPDGSQLVFTSDTRGKPQLFTIPSGGGTARRLPTQVSSFCTEPTWNPVDSGKIAFTAATGGGFQIALYDASEGRARVLTSVRGSAVEPAWLNDGRHLVFTQREGGSTRLVLLDSISGKMTPLHRTSFGSASSASFVY